MRVCDRASLDAIGNDADRVEFRYRDANNRIDMKCARTSVPSTWLVVSHISGPTPIQTINRVRDQRARVEGPEQTEQFAQLAAVRQNWWHDADTTVSSEVGVHVSWVGGLEKGNFHVQTESKLFVREPVVVPVAALVAMSHEGAAGRQVPRGPPALSMEAWSSAAQEAGLAIADQPSSSSALALRQHNKIEMEQRAFGAIASAETVEGDSDETAYGHVKDANRDAARDDRTFARSTAKLTPALFAEMTGGIWVRCSDYQVAAFHGRRLRGRGS